jgi:hypothetical protein
MARGRTGRKKRASGPVSQLVTSRLRQICVGAARTAAKGYWVCGRRGDDAGLCCARNASAE